MRDRRLRLLVVALASLAGGASFSTARELDAEAPIEAIWQMQVFELQFRADGERYQSCSSLYAKIRGIMTAMGAGNVVVSIGCSRGALVRSTHARIATVMPVPATPENIEAATMFSPEQEMVARLRQMTLPTAETIERFPAEWREVEIMTIDGVHLRPEDCDLLHDMHEQILPQLASVRVVRKRFTCGSRGAQLARPVLVVQALMRHER